MIRSYSDYCENGQNVTALSGLLYSDLSDQIARIAAAIQNAAALPSRVLLQTTRNSLRKSVDETQFFNKKGQCKGACEWFVALFLNFKQKYPNVPAPKLLSEISKTFEEGVGIQGACLQKIHAEKAEEEKILRTLNIDLKQHASWDLRNKNVSEEILNNVCLLEDGVYLLSFAGYKAANDRDDIPGHATVIIIEKGNYYFFDPNVGLAGTGTDIGSEDKISDMAFFLTMCKQYSPFDRASDRFEQSLENLSNILGEKDGKVVKDAITASRSTALKDKTNLCAFGVFHVVSGLENRGRSVTSEQFDELLTTLCIQPGMMRVFLEQSEKINLQKCFYLG